MESFRFSDRVIGLVLAAGAVAYLIAAWQIPQFALDTVPVQPRVFPLALGALLLLLAVLLAIRPAGASQPPGAEHDAEADGSPEEDAGSSDAGGQARTLGRSSRPRVEVLILVGGTAAYIGLLEPLGFIPATIAFLLAGSWWFRTARLWVAATVAVGVTLAAQLGLGELLGVRLPAGVLAPLGI